MLEQIYTKVEKSENRVYQKILGLTKSKTDLGWIIFNLSIIGACLQKAVKINQIKSTLINISKKLQTSIYVWFYV